MQKQCTRCKDTKCTSEFNYRDVIKTKIKSICKQCECEYAKKRYSNNKDHHKSQVTNWQTNNRDKYLEYQKDYNSKRKSNMDK